MLKLEIITKVNNFPFFLFCLDDGIFTWCRWIKFCACSSGILIILPASGNGTFHARFGDARALVRGTVSTKSREGKTYLNVDNLDVVLVVKDVQMRVSKVFNNNRILSKRIVCYVYPDTKNSILSSKFSISFSNSRYRWVTMCCLQKDIDFMINSFPRFCWFGLLIPAAEATNLFLRENGQEVLKIMEPQLKKKLSALFAGIVNQLLRHVAVESFLVP